jgi:hypothetical protein
LNYPTGHSGKTVTSGLLPILLQGEFGGFHADGVQAGRIGYLEIPPRSQPAFLSKFLERSLIYLMLYYSKLILVTFVSCAGSKRGKWMVHLEREFGSILIFVPGRFEIAFKPAHWLQRRNV